MPAAIVTLPNGQKARVTFDTPEQLDATIADLTGAKEAARNPEEAELFGVKGKRGVLSRVLGEPAMALASGTVAGAAGGVAGVARGMGAAVGALAQGEGLKRAQTAGVDEATETIGRVSQRLTYQPRTKLGKQATAVATAPFTLLAKGADVAGAKTAEVTGSPAVGAMVNTVVQSLPGALVPGARGMRGLMGKARSAPETPLQASGAPRQPPSDVGGAATGPATPGAAPVAPPELSATGAPRSAPSDIGSGEAPRGTPGATPPPANEAQAQQYARKLGLDWARLGAGTRRALATISQDAGALERLNPDAVRRQAHLESQRIPVAASRGQLTLDPVELRREAIAATQTEGAPIRELDTGANRDVQANLEVLRGRLAGRRGGYEEPVTPTGELVSGAVRSPTKTPTQVGESLQGVAREKAKWSKKGYNALYKLARETEPDARAGLKPVTDLLKENPDIQHLGWVQSWLNKARGTLERDAEGNLPELKDVTLNELDDLRQLANKNIAAGGTAGHYAGQLKQAIDTAMQDVPAGAAAWKRATDAFRKHQEEFKDQGLIQKLTSQKKGGADRALALEKTWRTVSSGSVEQIRQLKKSLLKGENPALRVKGAQAWKDLRAETVNRILEDARNVSSTDPSERAILTAAALRRSINRIPRENLEEIIGKGATRELYGILRAREITRGRTTQSGTVPNMLVMAEKILHFIPGVGKYAAGAMRGAHKLGELGETGRTVKEAQLSPLEQAVRDVERSSRKRSRAAIYETLEGLGPTIPVSPATSPPISEAMKRTPR